MLSLQQRQLLTCQRFTLTDDSLRLQIDTLGQSKSYDISFEQIYKVRLTEQSSQLAYFFLSLVSLGLGAAFYVDAFTTPAWGLGALGALFLALYFASVKKTIKIKLTHQQYLLLQQNNPNNEAVEQFLTALFERRDAYLTEQYGTINPHLGYNYQLEQFKRLYRLKVWTKETFDSKCKELEFAHRFMHLGFDPNHLLQHN